jgi:predicted RNase H-like HicB family nuclease
MAPVRKLYTFQIVIEKEPQGGSYSAYSPTLAGCFRRAPTLEEAKRRIRQALGERLEALLASGESISQNDCLVHVEELTIAMPERDGKTD